MPDWNQVLEDSVIELRRISSQDVEQLMLALGFPPDQIDGVLLNAMHHVDSIYATDPEGEAHRDGQNYLMAVWLDGFALGTLSARIIEGLPDA